MLFSAVPAAILRGAQERARTSRVNAIAFIPGMTARFAGRTAYFGPRFTASSRLAFADPGCSGFGWLSCGAQPDSQITS